MCQASRLVHQVRHSPDGAPDPPVTRELQQPASVTPLRPAVDIRAKRPAVVQSLLSRDTLRQAMRLVGLLVIDAASVYAAIFTALALKAAWLGSFEPGWHAHQAREIAPFTILIVLLNFGRMGLYGRRTERPGLGKIVTGLFQVMLVSMLFVLINGQREQFSSYYIFYGSVIVGVVYIGVLRLVYETFSARLLKSSGQQRRAILVGTTQHSDAVGRGMRGCAGGDLTSEPLFAKKCTTFC